MAKKKQGSAEAVATSGGGLGAKITELKEFFEQSKVEIKKVVWPTRKETIATCGAVLVFTVVMALFLGVVDFGVSKLIEAVLS